MEQELSPRLKAVNILYRIASDWERNRGDSEDDIWNEDAKDLRLVAQHISREEYNEAYRYADNLDTIVREEIPEFVWEVMGGI